MTGISNNMNEEVTLNDFDSLYRQFGPMVLRRCRYIIKDEEKALDCMQDVFVRIIEHKEKLTGVCSSLFYTTATRVCLNKIRSDKVRYSPQIDSLINEIADNSASHEEVTNASIFLDYIFNETKQDTRDMAIMHYVDGLTLEETAKQMNMSVSGVRKRLAHLRSKAINCAGE